MHDARSRAFPSLLPAAARRSARGIAALALASAAPLLHAGDAVLPSGVGSRLEPAALAVAIVDYIRWPDPALALRLCGSRGGPHSQQLTPGRAAESGSRVPRVQQLPPGERVPTDCDAVVFEGWSDQQQREALRGLNGRPVLTIGFGTGFCSDGGAVCLSPSGDGWTFEINADAVSRAGLKLNPRVLRLSRPAGRAGS